MKMHKSKDLEVLKLVGQVGGSYDDHCCCCSCPRLGNMTKMFVKESILSSCITKGSVDMWEPAGTLQPTRFREVRFQQF